MLLAGRLCAQATTPTLTQTLPAQTLSQAGNTATVDLRNYFDLSGVTGQIVQFDTVLGKFNVEMLPAAAPATVTNFLSYVNSGAYTNSFVHRSIPDRFIGYDFGIIQGGSYNTATTPTGFTVGQISTTAPIALEYNLPNTRGTLAMARTSEPNSATSGWFINTIDNSSVFGVLNGGGYAVFGRVIGTGMTIVDGISALDVWNAGSPFDTLPLRNYPGSGSVQESNLVKTTAITAIAKYPATNSDTAALGFTASSNATSIVTVALSGRDLVLTPGSTTGTATITVTATDTNGNVASGTFAVTVNADFNAWRAANFTEAELADTNLSGPNADFDGDGISNLVEYALGLDPKQRTTTGLPATTTTATDWIFTYTRPTATTDVTYAVEISTDHATWTTTGVTHAQVSTSGGTETWKASYPLASAAKLFFRLRVTRP